MLKEICSARMVVNADMPNLPLLSLEKHFSGDYSCACIFFRWIRTEIRESDEGEVDSGRIGQGLMSRPPHSPG